jgi:transposase
MSPRAKKATPSSKTPPTPQLTSGPAKRSARWEVINPHAAGIDVGATSHYVAVPPDAVTDNEKNVRVFGAFTPDLHSLVDWLKTCGVTTVAMESTGVYWVALFQILEASGIEVLLVNAKAVKRAPRRKTDVSDCQWLQQLHSYGLLSGSFRPCQSICQLRTLMRHRANLVSSASREIQHIQKSLQQMNLHLHHAVSDVMGATGQRILKAILAGERDPEALLALRDETITKSTPAQMKAALQGDYRPEHLFVVAQALEAYEFIHSQMEACDKQIQSVLELIGATAPAPAITGADWDNQRQPEQKKKKTRQSRKRNDPKIDFTPQLKRIFGIDLTQTLGMRVLSILVLLSEVGFDLSKFPNAKAFCAWLGLCPNNRVSGGRVLSSCTSKVVNRIASMLRLSAVAIGKTQTCLGWFYRRKCAQLGPAGAATATARKLAVIIYHLVTRREEYIEPDLAQYQLRYQRHRTVKLLKQLETMGYEVSIKEKSESQTIVTTA